MPSWHAKDKFALTCILPTVSRLSSELHGGFLFYEYHKEKEDRQTFKPVIKSPFKFLTPPAVSYPKVNFNPWTV
jgi:hypothetical protein